jgi:hypothetical protein
MYPQHQGPTVGTHIPLIVNLRVYFILPLCLLPYFTNLKINVHFIAHLDGSGFQSLWGQEIFPSQNSSTPALGLLPSLFFNGHWVS